MRDQSSLGGTDSFSGGAGSDYADTRDGLGENVACGSETDRVRVDPGDSVNGDCELRAPFQTAPMTLAGTVREGETLTAAPGTWTGVGPVFFTYTRCRWPTLAFFCTEIPGATAAAYTLVAADVDAEVGATVTATNGAGSELAQIMSVTVVPAAPISLAPPVVSGRLKPGDALTTTNGTWAVMARPIAFYGYQWQRCPRSVGTCTDVLGATGSTHVLSLADQGRRLRVYVVASNSVGSRARFSATTAVFDMRPPNTHLTSGPFGRSISRTATFKFTSTERRSTFRCRLDGGPWRSCRSGQRYQGLALGAHTFRVKARDAAGNLDPTPARRTWRVV